MKVKFKAINKQLWQIYEQYDIDLPTKKHDDAGYDVKSIENYTLKPNEIRLFKLGFSIEIPTGYEIQVRSKSGLSLKHGIIVLNSPGTIDASYRGEVGVILYNVSDKAYDIKIGDKIAQLILNKVETIEWRIVDKLSKTTRGDGGFGSTGRK